MKKTILTIFLSALVFGLNAAVLQGPFTGEAFTFYFVHNGGPLTLKANVSGSKNAAALVRMFDATEKEVLHDYAVIQGSKEFSRDFGTSAPKGIYQVRFSGKNCTVNPRAIPEKSFGIMPQRCMMNVSFPEQFKKVFFLIPEGAKTLTRQAYGSTPVILDAQGKNVPDKVDVSKHWNEVWSGSFVMKAQPYYRIGFGGMPVILCPDTETAKAIGGSVEKASDGTIYPHKFQVKMHEFLKKITKEKLKVEIVDLRKFEKEFRAEKNVAGLLGSWGIFTYINYFLELQNIDPAAKAFEKQISPTPLCVANSLNKPFNPYYGKLDNRILAAAFRPLLALKESETMEDSWLDYSGGDALGYVEIATALREGAASIRNAELRALWIDGAKRTADRFSMFRVSCENQSSHWPYIYQSLWEATHDNTYREMARDYISGMSLPENNPFMKTGYQQEAYGPDATYQGLGSCYQAAYYRMSGDVNAKKGLETVYNLMNHSVVPEPDGQLSGASNFSHRTAESWVHAQYGAGRALMKGELKGAACYYAQNEKQAEPNYRKDLAPQKHVNPNAAGYATAVFGPYLSEYKYPSIALPDSKLPVMESKNFVRNFNNEFIAIRKPEYYAFVYSGKTADKWTAASRPKTQENKRTTYRWAQLQGLSILWFDGFGSLVLGMNRDGGSAQILRGDLPDSRTAYPDYWEFTSSFSDGKIVMKSRLFQAEEVQFSRTIAFLEDGIRQTLQIQFGKDMEFKELFEQIPFLKEKKNDRVKTTPTEIVFNDAVAIRFSKPTAYEFGPDSGKLGSLRILLGKKFKAGTTIQLEYEIRKIKK